MFRQSSPGTHANTETVIRQAPGRSRGSAEEEKEGWRWLGDDRGEIMSAQRGEGAQSAEHGVRRATPINGC